MLGQIPSRKATVGRSAEPATRAGKANCGSVCRKPSSDSNFRIESLVESGLGQKPGTIKPIGEAIAKGDLNMGIDEFHFGDRQV